MFESIKAIMRRNFDRRFATTYLVGNGIDVGCGDQPISTYREFFPGMGEVRTWELNPDGDGALLEGVEDESYQFVHSSHSLEHMQDPYVAMSNWIRVLKKGGYMVLLLPDEDMFEQGNWPSKYAGPDHITAWTVKKNSSWCPASINVVDFFSQYVDTMEILKIEKLDSTYVYSAYATDQTRTPIGECGIEVIMRKKTDDEITRKGRLPQQQMFSYNT